MQPELYGKWIHLVQKVEEESNDQTLTQSSARTPGRVELPEHASTPIEIDQRVLTTHLVETRKEVVQRDESLAVETIVVNEVENPPTERDFDIPTSEEMYESMIERFKTVGLSKKEADEAIKARTTAYNRACREFKKKQIELKKQVGSKSSTRANKCNPKNI